MPASFIGVVSRCSWAFFHTLLLRWWLCIANTSGSRSGSLSCLSDIMRLNSVMLGRDTIRLRPVMQTRTFAMRTNGTKDITVQQRVMLYCASSQCPQLPQTCITSFFQDPEDISAFNSATVCEIAERGLPSSIAFCSWSSSFVRDCLRLFSFIKVKIPPTPYSNWKFVMLICDQK